MQAVAGIGSLSSVCRSPELKSAELERKQSMPQNTCTAKHTTRYKYILLVIVIQTKLKSMPSMHMHSPKGAYHHCYMSDFFTVQSVVHSILV